MADCAICTARPPRRAAPDRRACEVCEHELGAHLDLLTDRMPLLSGMLVPGGTPASVRLSRDGSPAPLRVDVLALLDDAGDLGARALLQPFADTLTIERDLPPSPYPITFLREHLEWATAAGWLETFARTLRRVAEEVRRVLGEDAKPVATCRREVGVERRIVDGDEVETPVECRGTITAAPYSDAAVCQRCGDVWERARWQMLGRLQEALP